MSYPSCCGSEDGELRYGVDPARRNDPEVMVEAWFCNTCKCITILHIIRVEGATA